MPNTEKEFNGNLLDQLTILERMERAQKNGRFDEEIEIIRKEINRKLYQKPPISDD